MTPRLPIDQWTWAGGKYECLVGVVGGYATYTAQQHACRRCPPHSMTYWSTTSDFATL